MRCNGLIAVVASRVPLVLSGRAILAEIAVNDVTQTLPFLLKILEAVQQLDA